MDQTAAYQVVLFDLDGTLTDSKIGITKSVQYALSKFNTVEDNLDNLERFIGPPLFESFQKYYSFNESEARAAVGFYREYFSEFGLYENVVYPGIHDLLADLESQARKLIVATSKPTPFANTILEHFSLSDYFSSIVVGSFNSRKTWLVVMHEATRSAVQNATPLRCVANDEPIN